MTPIDLRAEEERAFVATIYGEAAQSSAAAWKAIASVIMNRVGVREWRKFNTPLKVIANTGFDAFTQRNAPFEFAMKRLDRVTVLPPTSPLSALRAAVLPIYFKKVPVYTDAQLYWSPAAQKALHAAHPHLYREKPPWDWTRIEIVFVPGAEADDFLFYRYKEAPNGGMAV